MDQRRILQRLTRIRGVLEGNSLGNEYRLARVVANPNVVA